MRLLHLALCSRSPSPPSLPRTAGSLRTRPAELRRLRRQRVSRRRSAARAAQAVRLHRILAHQPAPHHHQPLGRQARHPAPQRLRLPGRRQRPLDKEILRAQKSGKPPARAGSRRRRRRRRRRQPRRLPAPAPSSSSTRKKAAACSTEQAAYLLGWTEAVAATGYRPGVYASGQPVPDGKGPDGKPITITTIQDIREHVAAQHLHPIAFWVIDDACPPAPGCVVRTASRLRPTSAESSTPTPGNTRSPRAARTSPRPAARPTTATATATPPAFPIITLDLSVSASPDPSHGR